MNWIKVCARLEQGAIDMMDHGRDLRKKHLDHRADTILAVGMCLAELARGLRAGITEGDQLIHSKEEEGKRNNKL
jgi:hypothetical protein